MLDDLSMSFRDAKPNVLDVESSSYSTGPIPWRTKLGSVWKSVERSLASFHASIVTTATDSAS